LSPLGGGNEITSILLPSGEERWAGGGDGLVLSEKGQLEKMSLRLQKGGHLSIVP